MLHWQCQQWPPVTSHQHAGAQPSITQEESASQTQREQVAEDGAHSDEEEGHDSHTTTDKTPAAPPPKDQAKPPNLPNGPRLWQKFLSNCYNASIATDIYNNLPTKREKHNFLGFSHPLSAAWLTAVPADYTALPNDVFNECLAVRLGVPVTRVEHACGCEHLKISKEPGYIAPTVTSASALQHAHSTLFEDGRHYNNTRHTKIKEIFTGELSTLLGYENIVAEKGDQNYTDKAGSKTRLEKHGNFYKNSVNPGSFMCADLFVRLGQLNLALDVNVAFAGGAKEDASMVGKRFGVERGTVADHNTDLKFKTYKTLYTSTPSTSSRSPSRPTAAPARPPRPSSQRSRSSSATLAPPSRRTWSAPASAASPSRRRRRSSARSAPPSWLTAGFARRARAARARERR